MTLDEVIKHSEKVVEDFDKIKNIKTVTLEECKYAEECRWIVQWLKELKQLREQTEWIPINKNSPKKGRYLTTILNRYDKLRYVMTCDYSSNGIWFPDDECASDNVIAWMPLPKEYEPQEGANEFQ